MTKPAAILVALLGAAVGVGVLLLSAGDDVSTGPAAVGESPARDSASALAVAAGNASPSLPAARASSADTALPRETRDWARSVQDSTDDFRLAQELVAAALQGDARAEYFLGEVLLRCEVQKRTLAPFGGGTIAERVERYLADQPTSSERSRATLRRAALRCAGVIAENPFAAYDLPEEARDFRYWSARALASGDPLAVMQRAYRSAGEHRASDGPDEKRAFREALSADVRAAVFSGDGAALFAVGGLLADPQLVDDPSYGYAWQVAACESGHDCSKANPYLGFGCVEDGTCVAGETWLDVLQRDLGPAKYAAIYANAQDIQYKIRTNDWDGLQQYLHIKE